MFPISIVIATTAMASGVEGATFFTPLFILALGLPADVAIGTGLITEVFGFASGLFGYAYRRLIDYRLGAMLLAVSIPAALGGTVLAGYIPGNYLQPILSLGLVPIAVSQLRPPQEATGEASPAAANPGPPEPTRLVTRAGETIHYAVRNRNQGRALAGVGGAFIGMISTGLGELTGYYLLRRSHIPSRVAVATTVLVVAVTALSASGGHVLRFVRAGGDTLDTVLSLIIFTIPGVILGGQLGSAVSSRIPHRTLERALAILFVLVAGLMLLT